MKAVVAAFNQEKALVGAFSVIVETDCGTDGSFYSTTHNTPHSPVPIMYGCGAARVFLWQFNILQISLKIFYVIVEAYL